MIYRVEDIYKGIKDGSEITSESEFMNLNKPESGDISILIAIKAYIQPMRI